MYALMEEIRGQGSPLPHLESDYASPADESRPTECQQLLEDGEFIEDTGLSAIRDLAVALGLVEIDDAGLWVPA